MNETILADGRSGANRNWGKLTVKLDIILADGRSGANRNPTHDAPTYHSSSFPLQSF